MLSILISCLSSVSFTYHNWMGSNCSSDTCSSLQILQVSVKVALQLTVDLQISPHQYGQLPSKMMPGMRAKQLNNFASTAVNQQSMTQEGWG